MLANFFSKSTPVKVLYLIVLLVVFYVLSVFTVAPIEKTILFGLFKVLTLFIIVFYLFVGLFIIRKNTLTLDNLYALFIIVLFFGAFQQTFFNVNYILSNVILLFAFRKIYSLKSGLNTKLKLFDAALWIGLTTLVYEWSALFLILTYVGMIVHQRISFKNLFIPILGLLIPIFLFFTYHFFYDSLNVFYESFSFNWSFDFKAYNSFKILIPLTFLITFSIWALFSVTPKIILISNKLKKSWYILLMHFFIAAIIALVSENKNGSEFLFMFFPVALIIANYLPKGKSEIFKNLMLYLFTIVAVSVYFL